MPALNCVLLISISVTMSLKPLTGAQRLRELLKDPNRMVLCPGVFDGITARLALKADFECLYMARLSNPACRTYTELE